ncbi:DUF397 domain-containing protein [Nonomuraea sp. NPDC026600]|uniref:DUF397 domain-containing protein n=1 Tax=Nonomuraea sp. NPDC026600 TaxID=3155363 RepID=UPI0033DCB1B9
MRGFAPKPCPSTSPWKRGDAAAMDELTRELETATWRKSTRSGPDGGNCVEVAELSGKRRGVRDSKNPAGQRWSSPPANGTPSSAA